MLSDHVISLVGPFSVIGRAFVVGGFYLRELSRDILSLFGHVQNLKMVVERDWKRETWNTANDELRNVL